MGRWYLGLISRALILPFSLTILNMYELKNRLNYWIKILTGVKGDVDKSEILALVSVIDRASWQVVEEWCMCTTPEWSAQHLQIVASNNSKKYFLQVHGDLLPEQPMCSAVKQVMIHYGGVESHGVHFFQWDLIRSQSNKIRTKKSSAILLSRILGHKNIWMKLGHIWSWRIG